MAEADHTSDDGAGGTRQGEDAVFQGWQTTPFGALIPMFTVTRVGHASFRSTVSDSTLRDLHLRVPRAPSPYPRSRPSPWHELGTELANPTTSREAIAAAGLDYTVAKKPMYAIMKVWARETDWATVRTDTDDVLGIVEDDYEPIQNRDAFGFFDSLVDDIEASYETAGVIDRGERIWILARLPGYIKVQGRDLVRKYLLLTNSHDGTARVSAKVTPIRMVCNNTLVTALRGAAEVHIRHTANPVEAREQALSLLGLANSLYGELDAVFNRMALTKISDRQLQGYMQALVPDNEPAEDRAENRNIRRAFLDLYETGQGADLSRGTLWGALNCVIEYADHKMEGNPTGRLQSIWFGRGEQLKLKAFRLARQMM